MDIETWLRSLGLARYALAFAENDIDVDVVALLTEDDLDALGMHSPDDRRRLRDAIATLRSRPDARAFGVVVEAESGPWPSTLDAAPGAERRNLSVLYCNLVGATELVARLGPEDIREVVRIFHQCCLRCVAQYDGWMANFVGDGVLAYFGWPRAHEDDAERAVRAGLALVAEVARSRASTGDALQARVGVGTGMVVVGDLVREGPAQEQSAVGETPNLAARLQWLGAPGQVVIDDPTRRLLADTFDFDYLGTPAMKGINAPVGVYVVGEERGGSRFESRSGATPLPMVGRDHELALLLERWAQAEQGHGAAVMVVGEAGIGKSRIARALTDALLDRPIYRVHYQCSPFSSDSPLWPVMAQLRTTAGLDEHDADDAALDKLEAVSGSDPVAMPCLAALMGYDGSSRYGSHDVAPQEQRFRTLDMLVQWVLRLATEQPVLLIVEDAHWIDPSTLEYVVRCLDEIADSRVMVLLTSRPENLPSFATHPLVQQLTLNRLGRSAVESIIFGVGRGQLSASTTATIISQTDGVPLFVEEVTKAVVDTGDTTVPASLRGSLMARLDRIPQAKEIAQIAACLGREFDHEVLAAIAQRPDHQLAHALDRLTAAELVFQRGVRPHAKYTFKHALVQEAAYASLLQSRRQQLHSRILDVLSAQRPPGAPELRAQHALKARRESVAVACWEEAGLASLAKSAYEEAAHYFGYALELVQREGFDNATHSRELQLHCHLGEAQMATHGYGASGTLQAFERARRLLTDSHAMALRVPVLHGMWAALSARGDSVAALTLGKALLDEARGQSDPSAELVALRMLGSTELAMGNLTDAREHLRRAAVLHDLDLRQGLAGEQGVEPGAGVAARGFLARAEFLMGDLHQAERAIRDALAAGAAGTSLHTQACARHHAALVYVLARDAVRAESEARELLAMAQRHRLRMWEAYARADLACAALELGRHSEAVEGFEHGLALLGDAGARLVLPFFRAALARALAAGGRVRDAWFVIDQAIAEIGPLLWCEAELWRVRGELYLAEPTRAALQAEECFERALATARSQSARAFELRAALSLAKLWSAQGEYAAAGAVLRPVVESLGGRFDTADLRDAKALLGIQLE